MCESLWAAGVPRDVLHFLPGQGETVGAQLVRDPRVAIIAFTGSKDVGLSIIAAAGQTPAEQPWIKRVVCEMGGKNAIIVDATADMDEAVLGEYAPPRSGTRGRSARPAAGWSCSKAYTTFLCSGSSPPPAR